MQKSQEKITHHAYLVEGYFDNVREKVLDFVNKSLGLEIDKKNINELHFKNFKIEDSRALNEIQSIKTQESEKEIIILSIESITVQAQNALLKTLEEPTNNKIFFIVSSINTSLLPTLRSRLESLSLGINSAQVLEGENFLQLAYKDRVEYIKRFLPDSKKGIPADKLGSLKLLDSIEIFLRKDLIKNRQDLEDLLKIKSYLKDPSSSVRNLLEYLCIFLPKI